MKRLLLLVLAAVPLFAFTVNFIYSDYDYYEDDYWYDEYWEDDYWCDGYWTYYPHGYYCVHYVWWYPWWWDSYWWRCHWHHHFHWNFFYSGFYVVWYDSGCWWFRPRYGRWVRYKVPHSYYTLRYRAKQHGIHLPSKPPRELNIPYKQNEIRKLMKQKDPELFKRVEKEHKSGNLEKMRKEYVVKTEKKIAVKNQEYKKYNHDKKTQSKTNETKKSYNYPANKRIDDKSMQKSNTKYTTEEKHDYNKKSQSHIIKRPKNESKSSRKAPPAYYYDDEKKTNKKQGKTKRPNQYDEKKTNKKQSKTKRPNQYDYEEREKTSQKPTYKKSSPQEESRNSYEKKNKDYHKPGTYNKKR